MLLSDCYKLCGEVNIPCSGYKINKLNKKLHSSVRKTQWRQLNEHETREKSENGRLMGHSRFRFHSRICILGQQLSLEVKQRSAKQNVNAHKYRHTHTDKVTELKNSFTWNNLFVLFLQSYFRVSRSFRRLSNTREYTPFHTDGY